MTDFLTLDDILAAGTAALGQEPVVLDAGLLESAIFRPQATVFGDPAYPDTHEQAAALLESLVKNRAFQDGNKRTALISTLLFLAMNGWRVTATQDERFDLVIAVATDELSGVADIAARLRELTAPM